MRQNNKMTCSLKKKDKKQKHVYVLSWEDVLTRVGCDDSHAVVIEKRRVHISLGWHAGFRI